MAKVDCIRAVRGATKEGELSDAQAEQLLQRIQNIAKTRTTKSLGNIEKNLRDVAGELKLEGKMMRAVDKRNRLLSIAADRRLQEFASRFKTQGEGVRAFLVGSSKPIEGSRMSVDYQAKALEGKYFGRLIAELEEAQVLNEFKSGENSRDIYIEMGELGSEDGHPGRSGNQAAMKIAKIVEGITGDMVSQQNRAGAFIKRNPGYVTRQMHDRDVIRRAGVGPGYGKDSKAASFRAWDEFTRPLVDAEKTFQGYDPDLFMRKVHEALYTGIHGAPGDEADVDAFGIHGSMAKKASSPRVLHFKDPESAFQYNEKFGVKHLRDAITSDIHFRSRSIALMENLGPNPEENLTRSVRSMQEKAREGGKLFHVTPFNFTRFSNEGRGKVFPWADSKEATFLFTSYDDAIKFHKNLTTDTDSLPARFDKANLLTVSHSVKNLKKIDGTGMRGLWGKIAEELKKAKLEGFQGAEISNITEHGPIQAIFDAEQVKIEPDAAKQVDSLSDWRIQAELNAITGKTSISANPGLSRNMQTVRSLAQLAKMGMTVLNSFADKAFLQAEMAYQGMDTLTVLGKQLTGMAPRTGDERRTLRLMGVAMDGLLGNVASRYSMHDTMHGWAHRAQRSFFDLNFLNTWTDANKATAAELMAAHLGEHADLPHEELPEDLRRVLGMYEIDAPTWDIMRQHAWENDKGDKFITADKLRSGTTEEQLDSMLADRNLKPTAANRARQLDRFEAQLRTYFADRIDIAIPTGGAAERTYTSLNTQAGTPLGEAVRLIMLFKNFPITILNKVISRDIYGQGYDSIGQWIMNDHKGKFHLAQMVAMTMAAGYLGGVVRDALRGRTPKELVSDGQLNWSVINDAMLRGGGLGIMGDFMFTEYDRSYRSFLGAAAGPVIGQLDPLAALRTSNEPLRDAGKLALDNAPFINLFYIRPVLDYFVLWNLQEMMSPGTLTRQERRVREKNHQDFFITPSETVR